MAETYDEMTERIESYPSKFERNAAKALWHVKDWGIFLLIIAILVIIGGGL